VATPPRRNSCASDCGGSRARCAASRALDKVALGLLDEHARHCVIGAEDELRADRTDELMGAVGRLMRRG
jgi:hypothetical protein